MKKILLALSLIGCLLLSAVSCTNQETEGEGTKAPVSDQETEGEGTKAPVSDQTAITSAGSPDESGAPSGEAETNPSDGNSIANGGANTEGGWGPLHPAN